MSFKIDGDNIIITNATIQFINHDPSDVAYIIIAPESFDVDPLWTNRVLPFNTTYRTTPIQGAELGGILRNPEDNVIDEIDRLVDWQIEHGETGEW